MINYFSQYLVNQYSQNGEDGVIQFILNRLGLTNGVAVEFGGTDGYFCSNTALLREQGWEVHQFDGQPSGPVKHMFITEDNVNELPKCNFLSIDIDGNDYGVWKAYKGTPEVVIIEIHSGKNPIVDDFSPDSCANYSIMLKLGLEKGYFLVCHTGNLIFVRNEFRHLFPEVIGDGLSNYQDYFLLHWQ